MNTIYMIKWTIGKKVVTDLLFPKITLETSWVLADKIQQCVFSDVSFPFLEKPQVFPPRYMLSDVSNNSLFL